MSTGVLLITLCAFLLVDQCQAELTFSQVQQAIQAKGKKWEAFDPSAPQAASPRPTGCIELAGEVEEKAPPANMEELPKWQHTASVTDPTTGEKRRRKRDDPLPEEFDWTKEPIVEKCPSIAAILDQGQCGSCWAVATASMISDRVCMASNGTQQVYLSALNMLSCCIECSVDDDTEALIKKKCNCDSNNEVVCDDENSVSNVLDCFCEAGEVVCANIKPNGCNGGYPSRAAKYWAEHSLATGGDQTAGQPLGCLPYPQGINNKTAPSGCSESCSQPGEQYKLHSTEGAYYALKKAPVETIMTDIIDYGPLVMELRVYEDFGFYKSGVYEHTTGELTSAHAMKVVGWGEEDGVPYWLFANSWTKSAGENGFFKIRRGTNEVGIENIAVGVDPQ